MSARLPRPAALVALAALAACAPSAADAPIAEQWRAVEVESAPLDLPVETVGRLRLRGVVELRSDSAAFGGLSGLEALENGRFIAVSDDGAWFDGRLVLDEEGALVGVADVRTALMRDETGAPFASKRAGDAEGLAQLPDGRFAVSFEQSQTIRLYDLNRDGPFGAARPGPALAETARLPANAGLEALAATADGALLVGAEGGGAPARLWRAPLTAEAPVATSGRYRLRDGFSLTSLDRLPDGGFVALERFYAPVIGARARIARFGEDAVEAGGEIAAEELALIAPPMPVDNFEAIAAARAPDGAVRLYILSDDNFSNRQRTLLYAFDLVEAAPADD
jgi:hypothetical protein